MDKARFDAFEDRLCSELVKLCTEKGMMSGQLLHSDDIDGKWGEFARDYMADAVHNYNEYPDVALAWAAYLGMGIAHHWDQNWLANAGNTYSSYFGSRGYDDMDEHIVRDIMGIPLDSDEAAKIAETLSSCSSLIQTLIRHEGFESQSVEAYYALVSSVKVMFRIGESLALSRLGYSLQPLQA